MCSFDTHSSHRIPIHASPTSPASEPLASSYRLVTLSRAARRECNMQPLPSRLARGGLHSLPRPSFQLAMPDSGNDGHASHASQKGSGGDCNPGACKAERNLAPNKGASAVIVQRHFWVCLALALALAVSQYRTNNTANYSIAAYPAWKESRHITIVSFNTPGSSRQLHSSPLVASPTTNYFFFSTEARRICLNQVPGGSSRQNKWQ